MKLLRFVLRGIRWALPAVAPLALLAGRAAAIDVELPGERKLEIHGYYELRLVGLGDDLPSNGVTFSQFRHILNLETEVGLFPDGIGPFDLMSIYARTAVRYDCIYTHACGLFPSANAWGDLDRPPDRLPYNIRDARNAQFIGGSTRRTVYAPGTTRSALVPLNPGRTPRPLYNPPDEVININELAFLANLNHLQRNRLDLPVDRFLVLDNSVAGPRSVRTRAGAFPASYRESHLLLMRDDLGPQNSAYFEGLINAGRFLSAGQYPTLRTLNGQIGTLVRTGDPGGRLPELVNRRNALLFSDPNAPSLDTANLDYFMTTPDLQSILLYPAVKGAENLNLIASRADRNIFERLSRASTPELLEATFGGMRRSNAGVATYFATLGVPPRPLGAFNTYGRPVDLIVNTASGMGATIGRVDVGALPEGLIGGSPGANYVRDSFQLSSRPLYVGRDGRPNTADDLPQTGAELPAGLSLVGRESPDFPVSTWSAAEAVPGLPKYDRIAFIDGTVDDRVGASTEGKPFILFGVISSQALLQVGCQRLGGSLSGDQCLDAGSNPIAPAQVRQSGCTTLATTNGGLNSQGECLVLNVEQGSPINPIRGVDPEELDQLSNPAFRPQDAVSEPTDLTDFRNQATDGFRLPARPHAKNDQLFFGSKGLTHLQRSSHHIVSNLDIDFSMDELEWGHGASDDEHEFREGFIETELFDSQLFARVGKLLMVWGKTELFRNQDRLNPIDLSEGVVTRLEEARVGQWAVDLVYSPEWAMRMGRFEDLRVELAVIWDDFEPQDFGVCGESSSLDAVCLLPYGVMAHGMTGIGVAGAENPSEVYSGIKAWDYGVRLEGRMDRFTFAVTDFWGWDDNFVLEVIQQWGRKTDPLTGAPTNSTGPLDCKVRTLDGVSVGPNGVAGDGDDTVPSVGNCLLFDNPASPTAPQALRAGTVIAANHSVNQTLFHTICSLNFDPDIGSCAFDQINDKAQFEGGAQLLSGIPLAVQSSVLEGIDTIRLESQSVAAPSFSPGPNVLETAARLFKRIDPGNPNSLPISRSQGSLIGCGASFVSPCGQQDLQPGGFATGQPYFDMTGFPAAVTGGPDFMNADASVVMQDFSILKGLQPGPGVGTRPGKGGLRYQTGISLGGQDAPEADVDLGLNANDLLSVELDERGPMVREAVGLEDDPLPLPAAFATDGWIEPYPWKVDPEPLKRGILVFQVADLTQLDPRCDPQSSGRRFDALGFPVFSEPEIVYCTERDPAWLPSLASGDPNDVIAIMNDPTDPTNPANEFVVDFEGTELDLFSAPGVRTPEYQAWIRQVADLAEQCTPFMDRFQPIAGTRFNEGCTALETVSSNIERFLAAVEIMGPDRAFDPPESFDELQTVVDGDFSNDAFGDPIAGPDGIHTSNFRVFAEGPGGEPTVADVHGVLFTAGFSQRVITPEVENFDFAAAGLEPPPDAAPTDPVDLSSMTIEQFFAGLNPESACGADNLTPCNLKVGDEVRLEEGLRPAQVPVGSGMPIAMRMNMPLFDGSAVGADLAQPRINLMQLLKNRPMDFNALWNGEQVLLEDFTLKYDRNIDSDPETEQYTVTGDALVRIPPALLTELRSFNVDGDPVSELELDEDQDGIYDGVDDGAPGPATDDNVLCGSGLPGDPLQNAAQHDLVSQRDEEQLAAAYPRGFPVRSPTLCRTLNDLLISSGQTLPLVRAGGDSRYGRRDFLWHGGQELTLTWEKRNVLGFAVDFAEDRTGTSWGIEFAWTHDAHVANSSERSGISSVDPMVLSVSIDRPTFFNFLNPNRSFFLNFQFFLQYVDAFKGGGSEDGNFPYAEGPWSGLATFTFFTGYFQDRLNPRATLVYEPTTHQGIVLWSLNYRWTATFSTALGVNHFFGGPEDGQRYVYPFTLFQNSFRKEDELFRGFNAVTNRDSVELNARYTW